MKEHMNSFIVAVLFKFVEQQENKHPRVNQRKRETELSFSPNLVAQTFYKHQECCILNLKHEALTASIFS
jgi:hypothetical protein